MSIIIQIIFCSISIMACVAVLYLINPLNKEHLKKLGNRRFKKEPSDFLSALMVLYFMALAMLENFFSLSMLFNLITALFIGWGMSFVYYVFCLIQGRLIVYRLTKDNPAVKEVYYCSQTSFGLSAIAFIFSSVGIFASFWIIIIFPILTMTIFYLWKKNK